jgi:Raf kinase inhibitor-like YbhB/YbcL family protein
MTATVTDIRLTCPAFQGGQPIPRDHTADGRDVSPPLKWGDVPRGTKSLALICEDPDAPRAVWAHWVAWNLPAESRELSENVPKVAELPNGMRQGTNGFGKPGYNGPSPPPGQPHRYFFILFALDAVLDLKPGTDREQLMLAMQGHVIGKGEAIGTYGRLAER